MKKEFELSIVIPSRSEMFLARTIEDILANTSEKTEVIAVLDGEWASPAINDHPRVNIIHLPESIGQRAATNVGVRLSRAKYVAKMDAHVALDRDWDIKMIDAFKKTGDNVTMVSIMKNLHAFNWRCYHNYCGWFQYQGPTPTVCPKCGKSNKIRKEMLWKPKANVNSTSYCFDNTCHFQYFEDWKHRPQYIKDKKGKRITETMSLQGSCFMATREKYWELKLCDEEFGSWGNQAVEVACKTWLSGGRVLVNHATWYAHLFRTQGSDFSFPYPQSGNAVARCKAKVRKMFWKNEYPNQIHPLSWLIEKFSPVPTWDEKSINDLKKSGGDFVPKK